MTNRVAARWRLRAAGIALALMTATLPYSLSGADVPATGAPTNPALADYVSQVGRLVENQKIDELAALTAPAAVPNSELPAWTAVYVAEIRKADALREKHFQDRVKAAKDFLSRGKLDDALLKAVDADSVAADRDNFLTLDWVKELVDKASTQAAQDEKTGKWLDSLQLYSNLNDLFNTDTRFKPDTQRLARRVRLLAVYTPKTLYDMRKALAALFEKDNASATKPDDEATAPPIFTRWQDIVSGIDVDMARRALDQARELWVEPTNYETLLRGGADALRLFLSTPELNQEFPALADEKARNQFAAALDVALAQIRPNQKMDADTMHGILDDILAANSRTIKLPTSVALMEFTDGAMEKLDPFTNVIWPHEAPEFNKTINGVFGGVGIQLEMKSDGRLMVVTPLPDTPAFAAGVKPGDVITEIDGKSTSGLSIDHAVDQIVGKPDTEVVLTMQRPNVAQAMHFALKRAIIHVASVKGFKRDADDKWQYMIDPDNKIGYIRITGFQDETATELKTAIEGLQDHGARALVIDLRYNPGGLLRAAIEMGRFFLNTNTDPIPTIVSTKGNMTARWEAKAKGEPFVPPSMPLVVLVNQNSASASEIFSGAIKDLHRGLIVGQRSFGKGSVQEVVPIGEGTEADIKLTKSYYYLPEGESLHRRDGEKKWGVEPDVTVPMTPTQYDALREAWRDLDILGRGALPVTEPATAPATQMAGAATQPAPEALIDTQLDTALLMLRLQLVQPGAVVVGQR